MRGLPGCLRGGEDQDIAAIKTDWWLTFTTNGPDQSQVFASGSSPPNVVEEPPKDAETEGHWGVSHLLAERLTSRAAHDKED